MLQLPMTVFFFISNNIGKNYEDVLNNNDEKQIVCGTI